MREIAVSDVSLYESSKSDKVNLSFKEKLEIARRLQDLGADVVELFEVKDKADEVLVKTVCACVKKTTLSIHAGNSPESAEKNASLLSLAKKKRLVVDVPSSPVAMEYSASKKPVAVIEFVGNMVKKCRSLCQEVEVCFLDATRSDVSFLSKAIAVAKENGASVITLTDYAGNSTPEEFSAFLADVKTRTPELSDVKLAVACKDVFSMGTACCLAGIFGGADEIKICSVTGFDYPKTESLFSAIEFIGAKKGYSCSVNKTESGKIVEIIERLACKGGTVNFPTESGQKSLTIEDISENRLKKLIKNQGYDLNPEDFRKVTEEVKRLSAKKTLTLKDIDVIASTTALQVPETFTLDRFSVNSSNVLTATASVVLLKGGKPISGLSYGNGAVDASFLALEKITGEHFELEDFEIGAVTEGKEAVGQAVVKLRADGKVYSGSGVSTDIIGASIRAYVNAVNKIYFERNGK